EEIMRLCEASNKLLTVNHQKKYLPAWKKAKEWVDSGTIGRVEQIQATCKGNLLEQGTHLLDLVLHFNNYNPVQWVMGQIDDLEGLDKAASAPDAAVARISFENGVRALVETGTIGRDVAS